MQSIMLNTLSLYEVFAYFFLYSFLGWVSEVAFHAVKTGKFINRGFLNGPVCPIYGVGVTCILLMLGKGAEKAWLVFLVGIAFPTLIELITGWALETFFHNKWWDPSSANGRGAPKTTADPLPPRPPSPGLYICIIHCTIFDTLSTSPISSRRNRTEVPP